MRIPRSVRRVVIALAVLIGLPVIFYGFLMDHQNAPLCHSQLGMALLSWLDVEKTDVLPNVDGRSTESLALLFKRIGWESSDTNPWNERYMYLPGLRRGDPGDLVLMYLAKPTRYIWHDYPHTVIAKQFWMFVPLDFDGQSSGFGSGIGKVVEREIPNRGECSERVSVEEFRSRLKKTLDFLRANDRPNWQTVVAEHEKFLDAIQHDEH